ncbi:MAG TPA: orotidine-5'-phosphate decarboxylase [Stellaceae bacterium]|nr:orotidine-5'-phosphate decarboxylase [Stellaceae bacterium]
MTDLARDRLIVALDVASLEDARAIVDELGDEVSFYKVGPHLFVSGLINFIDELIKERRKHVFLDFKSFDIGDTVRVMASRAAKLGIEFMTIARAASTITAAQAGREGRPIPKILVVTLLTDQSQDDMQREFNTKKSVEEFVAERAQLAEDAGADGVICSPNEVRAVRRAVRRRDFLIVTPGIRLAESASDDQKRTASPANAIAAGADYLVVGRPIVRAPNRLQAARLILGDMQQALVPSRIRAAG